MFKDIEQLGKQTAQYALGNLLTKGIGFFLIPLYTHYLTPKDYGILELIDMTCNLLSVGFALGITNSILRFYVVYANEVDKEEVINSALIFSMISGLFILLILLYNTSLFSNIVFQNNKYSFYFKFAFINIFIAILHTHCKAIFRVRGKPRTFIFISILTTVSFMVLNIYFIAFMQIGIIGFYYSSIIAFLPVTILILVNQFTRIKVSISIDKIKEMLKYGIFFVPTLFIGFIINYSDRYFLRIFTNLETVGLYALGSKIGMVVSFLVGTPFELVWGAYAFEIEKKETANKIFARTLTYITLLSVFVALSIALLSKEIVSIMASPPFIDSHIIIPFIAASMVAQISTNVFRIGILIRRKTHYLPIISGIVALVNIALNLTLTPKYGMVGAGLSNLISFSLFPLISYWISDKLYSIEFEFMRLFKIIAIALCIFFISMSINVYSIWQSILLKVVLLTLLPITLLLSGFFDQTEKKYILKSAITIRDSLLKMIPSQN
jgi:O-antigen/teichoic acid export membrane protein